MSRPNPFTKGTNSQIQLNTPSPNASLPSFDQPLGRSAGRQSIRKDEQIQRQTQYRRFMDAEHESKNFMTKTAGRQMKVDTKRPVHKVWLYSMGIMACYTVFKWTWEFTRPHYYQLMETTTQGYAVSMTPTEELLITGPLTEPIPYKGKPLDQAELTAIKEKKKELENKKYSEQDQIIPCYSLQNKFKQCMSYDQMRRKLDQCMPALQNYNQCIISHRTGQSSSIDPVKRQKFFDSANLGAKSERIEEIATIAQNIVAESANHRADFYLVPVDHSTFRY